MTRPATPATSGRENLDNALRARCREKACGHIWVVAYLPMEVSKAARLAKRAACPKCGDIHPVVA